MNKIVLTQTVVSDYRHEFLRGVSALLGDSFTLLAGDEYFYSSVKTKLPVDIACGKLHNVYMVGRRFLFQVGGIRQALRARVAIFELNPRILSVWIVLLARYVLRRPTVLWGHAWPRNGRGTRSDILRGIMRRRASVVLVYTESQVIELMDHDPSLRVIAAPNALYRSQDMVAVRHGARRGFIYVGRLVADKRVSLLVRAMAKYVEKNGASTKLHIVGDGPEREALIRLVDELGVTASVVFYGHVGSLEVLREIYAHSLAAISPGYVGLSITQSLGFGVPMIIADKENHSPEIEAAYEGENCLFFRAGDDDDLSQKMKDMLTNHWYWVERSESISANCRTKYSAETMSSRFVQAVRLASSGT